MTRKRNPSRKASNIQESYFDAERILDEKKVGGKWLYLIKWSGHDRNGKPWSPDWQPKDNCTAMLIKEWEQEKVRQRKKQAEQKDKENHKGSNQEKMDVVQDDDPMDLQDNNNSNNNNSTINKTESNNPYSIMERGDKINGVDGLKYVLDKYCQNMSEDIKRKTLSFARYEDCDPIPNSNFNTDTNTNTNSISYSNTNSITNSNINSNNLISNSNVKKNIKPNLHSFHVKINNSKFIKYNNAPRNIKSTNSSSKILKNFPSSKVKLVKISPIQPSIISNSPIKSNISILDPNINEIRSHNKSIRGKKFSLPSKSERLSLYSLNKRSLDNVQDPNNDSATKRQKTEDDMNRKENVINSSINAINSSINANEKVNNTKDSKDEKDSKDSKDGKDSKDDKDTKDVTKDDKDTKDVTKDVKVTKDATKDVKVTKDADNIIKDAEDIKILPSTTTSTSSTSLNVENKNVSSQTNELPTSQPNESLPDDNLSSSQCIQSSTHSTQSYDQSQSGINSENIKSQDYRSSSISKNSSSTSSSPPKFRPIAAKITSSPSSSPSPSQYNSPNVCSSSSSSSKSNSTSSTSSNTSSSTSSSTSSNTLNNTSSALSTEKLADNNISTSSSNRHSSRLASIRNNSGSSVPKSGSSSSQVANKIVPLLTTQHKSYFHKSYVQPISLDEDSIAIFNDDNNVTHSNQSVIMTSPQSISPTIMQINERSNHQQSSIIQNTNTGSFIMENNDSVPSFDAVQRVKELSYELVKVRSYNESLEKDKMDLIKEKNKYASETYQLRVEVERRPWSNSEANDTIRKCQENIQKLCNKVVESQNKYVVRCNEYKKLDIEHSRLQNEYNQTRRIMMGKQSEIEILKEDLNNANQELKKLREENNNITKNSIILMQDEYHKFTRLQNSLQELIDQRTNINKAIDNLKETINQEVVKMRRTSNNQDEGVLGRQIQNLKMQNKLQEISLKMAEENSTIAEDSAKLMLEVRKLNAAEILKNYDVSSIPNISSTQANFLREGISSSLQSQNRENQSEDYTQRMEIRPIETNSSHGNVNNNTNVQGLSTVPFFESLPNNNYHDTRLFENPNAFRNSTAFVRGNTNLRKLPTTSTKSTRIGQSKGSTPRTSLNSTSSVSTGRKFKVIATGNPVKSFQKMNYFCEWNLCKRSFNDKFELKKHIKEDHLDSEENSIMKDKTDDLAEVKIEV